MNEEYPEPVHVTYSQRLGPIAPAQFQAALSRFDLGIFVDAASVEQGLFGQNVFVHSTQGAYVLRGVPHYPWQFPKERFGADLLHRRTRVPVAHPYLYDPTIDIFGWPYLLMPRLRGRSPTDPSSTQAERLGIAQALGENLAHMHQLTWSYAGAYDLVSDTIQPFESGYTHWTVQDVRDWLVQALSHGTRTTAEDVRWIEHVIALARSALDVPFQPCFVMNDYNPGNMLVDVIEGHWQVTGTFDLMEYHFGDGEADLMRLIAVALEQPQQYGETFARTFATTYLTHRPPRSGFHERYALFMLRDRLIAWEYGTRPGMNWFPEHRTFRDYAEPFTMSWRVVAPDIAIS